MARKEDFIEERVVNPYNFIPFSESTKAPDRSQPTNTERRNTGWMDVTLTPRTCIIIPDGANPLPEPDGSNHPKHKSFTFYKLNNEPAIPGSSIRGMIRSTFEAASNSCLPFLRDREELTMRTPVCAAYKNRGLLRRNENNNWELYKVIKYQTPNGFAEGKCICKLSKSELGQLSGGRWRGHENAEVIAEGVLQFHKPVSISNDAKYHIKALEPDGGPIKVWESSTPYDSLRALLEATVDEKLNAKQAINTHKTLLKALEDAKRDTQKYVPVWYIKVGNEYFISPSAVGRVHQHSWEKIMGEYTPCSDLNALCPACRLFGTVAGKGLKGRVRFTDALYTGRDEPSIKTITLGILASPKPTAYEFYLSQPSDGNSNAVFWNYNYYSIKTADGSEYKPLEDRLMPRGRKFYWHDTNAKLTDNQKSDLNATMDYLEPKNAEFKFRIYFDGISDIELNRLKWVLTFGENMPDGQYCHKIGHARPLGFGTVKLTIDSITMRRFVWEGDNLALNMKTCEDAGVPGEWPEQDGQGANRPASISALLKLADINAVGDVPVMYPNGLKRTRIHGQDDYSLAIFQWFSSNRTSFGIKEVLPDAVAEDISVSAYVEKASAAGQGINQQHTASTVADTYTGTIKSKNGIVVYVTVDNLDAPGFFKNDNHLQVKVGQHVIVRKKKPGKNAYGNYDIDIVRFC